MFEELLHDRGSRSSQRCKRHPSFQSHGKLTVVLAYYRHRYEEMPPESQEEFQSRVRRATEEQERAAERRRQEDAQRKEQREEQREKGMHCAGNCSQRTKSFLERMAAEVRQKAKASKKKSQAEALRKTAEKKAKAQLERSQDLRSAVFAAARNGDSKVVKKGIYEDQVDAAGGEVKRDCDEFVKSKPRDPSETLSHIAAARGDVDLVEWLDTHGKCLNCRQCAVQAKYMRQVRIWRNATPRDIHPSTLPLGKGMCQS